jgi:hypothetical protein
MLYLRPLADQENSSFIRSVIFHDHKAVEDR